MEELSVEKSNWSEVPSHLLDIIMDKLSSPELLYSDYIRFGAVCDSWYSAFCDHDPPPRFPTLLLILPPPPPHPHPPPRKRKNNQNKKTRLRKFYSISDEKKRTRLSKIYNISDEKMDGTLEEVRMPSNRHCRGSSHGWLITADHDKDKTFPVRLFNPVLSTNGIEILLPSLKTLTLKYRGTYGPRLEKAVLSANPLTNPTDYTVMAIYGIFSSLAFFKPGNKSWTCIDSPKTESGRRGDFTDVIYCHMYGKFFAVTWDGAVVAVSDNVAAGEQGGMIAKLVIQPSPLPDQRYTFTKKYLIIVESFGRGELLKVDRFINKELPIHGVWAHETTGFRVFKLKVTGGAKEEEEYYEWQEVKSLGGHSFFLDHNTSISIRASDYPGCKPNSIYYTDDYDACINLDIGIFNLEDGSFKRHLPNASKNTSVTVWIQPSLPNKNRRSSSNISSC